MTKETFTQEALRLGKKAEFNLNSIAIDYFSVIQKADNKIDELEKEIKNLKYKLEFEKHCSAVYLKEMKQLEKGAK